MMSVCMKNYNVIVSLALLLLLFFVQGCAEQNSQAESDATIFFQLSPDSINTTDNTFSVRSVTGAPDTVSSIIISVTTNDGELLGSADILLAGGSVSISVPAHVPLIVIGTGYAENQALFRGRSDVEAMRPGQRTSVSFSLEEITEGNGIVQGTVRDAASNTPVANVLITVYDAEQTRITTTTTDAGGEYSLTLPPNENYTLIFSGDGRLPATYVNIPIIANETNILETVLQIAGESGSPGGLSGQIVDATTGVGLSGVNIALRNNINAQAGEIVAETIADSEGNYSFGMTLAAGNYTCEISLDGYIRIYKNIVVIGGQIMADQNASISRAPLSGATRIVLTWGGEPADLDSHLTGPVADNATELFHVYYANPGSDTAAPFSILDVDDTSAFGPETTTVVQQFAGVYKYSVHDFTNSSNTSSMGLAESGAKVEVYRENQLIRTFNVPTGEGVLWAVFEMDGDTITPINTINNDPTPNVLESD